jgi:putative aldouronate transport system permease protein
MSQVSQKKEMNSLNKISIVRHSNIIRKNWDLYLLMFPVVVYFIIFKYAPMYGVQIAFKDFIATKGIWGSPVVGLKHFMRFFRSYHFESLIKNTVGISVYQLLVGFPIPIILALMMNEVKNQKFKKTVQTVTYAPHFLSTVVLVGMMTSMLSPRSGVINKLIKSSGMEPIYFMAEPEWFKSLYVWSGIWQNAGWNSVIYMAALSGIDIQLYEAAIVDGATKRQRMFHVTIPGILPTAITLLILNTGKIMSVGFEKVFLMQNGLNLTSSEVISTYVYKVGLVGAEYSFSTAVGLFNSIINFILLIVVNRISRKTTETSLW